MKPEVLKYLEDINFSIRAIEHYTSDLNSLQDYENDAETIDSVERRLGIIGEALNQADKLAATLIVSDKPKIIKLRHILIHNYDLITDAIIWDIIQNNLPLLKEEIQTLLEEKNG